MTDSEKFFLSQVRKNIISVSENGIVFNNKTCRNIGAIGSGKYFKISMKDVEENVIRHIQIHRLMWLIYKGSIPNGMVINHIDGIKTNNKLTNLELTTVSGNTAHAVSLGLISGKIGSNNMQSKLNEDIVSQLRKSYSSRPFLLQEKARQHGVSVPVIRDALIGKFWSHVETPPVKIVAIKSGRKIQYPKTRNSIQLLLDKGYSSKTIVLALKNKGSKMNTIHMYKVIRQLKNTHTPRS